MKRTFTLTIAGMLLAITAFASPHNPRPHEPYYANGSRLSLNLLPRGTYTVVMNGVRYYDVRDIFEVSGLTAGSHHIRVIEYFGHRHHGHIIYDGYINIPYRSDVIARLTPHNRIMIQQVNRIAPPPRARYHGHGHGDHHDHGNHNGHGNRNRSYRKY